MPAHPNDPLVIAQLRRMSGAERVRLGVGLSTMAWHLVESGVRAAHPDWDDDRVRAEIQRRIAHSRTIYGATTSPV